MLDNVGYSFVIALGPVALFKTSTGHNKGERLMTNKNKLKYIKKIFDIAEKEGNWDFCEIMCEQISCIVNYENLQDWARKDINSKLNIK